MQKTLSSWIKSAAFLLITISTLSCGNKLEGWTTFEDRFGFGSISLPTTPTERIDTIPSESFAIIYASHMSSIDNEGVSPSTFGYNIYFPTDNTALDFFEIKKDTAKTNQVFENMIQGALSNSVSELGEKSYFSYPEPGVRFTAINKSNGMLGICRLIIFDNYVILTGAYGTTGSFSNESEEEFFKSLKINSGKRNRK